MVSSCDDLSTPQVPAAMNSTTPRDTGLRTMGTINVEGRSCLIDKRYSSIVLTDQSSALNRLVCIQT